MTDRPSSGIRQGSDLPRILGVNGIRSNGEKNTDRLLRELELHGHPVHDFNYGRVGFFAARSVARQKAIGHRLHETAVPGDHVVAHSYGGLVVLRAMQCGARFGHVWLFAPAMDLDFTFPLHAARTITVVHCVSDLALFGGWLLFNHAFGNMGRVGYQGPYDPRVRNIAVEPRFLAHSAYFKLQELSHWAQLIDDQLRFPPDRTAGIPARSET